MTECVWESGGLWSTVIYLNKGDIDLDYFFGCKFEKLNFLKGMGRECDDCYNYCELRLDWINCSNNASRNFHVLTEGCLLASFFDTKLMARWLSVMFTILPVLYLVERNGRRTHFSPINWTSFGVGFLLFGSHLSHFISLKLFSKLPDWDNHIAQFSWVASYLYLLSGHKY